MAFAELPVNVWYYGRKDGIFGLHLCTRYVTGMLSFLGLFLLDLSGRFIVLL